jgi:hypothetical protein
MSDPIVFNAKSIEAELLAVTGKATTTDALALVAQLVEQSKQAEASLTTEELRYARALNLDPKAVAEFKATRK